MWIATIEMLRDENVFRASQVAEACSESSLNGVSAACVAIELSSRRGMRS